MHRAIAPTLLALLAVAGIGFLASRPPVEVAVGKARDSVVSAEVVTGWPDRPAQVGAMRGAGFTEQVQLGFGPGFGWEPAMATDRFDHVYLLYSQYEGVPGCPDCTSPSSIFQVSNDGGETWESPRLIIPGGSHPNDGQWDPQIAVDPVDGRTVYALWMQNFKDDLALAKSTDFGETWSVTIAEQTKSITDKPVLAVRGQDIYIAYSKISAANSMWFSVSHDGGETFVSKKFQNNPPLGLPLVAAGTITSDGTAWFSWGGYKKPGSASGEITLFLTRSSDGGETWETSIIDHAQPGPECAEPCGWAYLSPQMVMTSDEADHLYLLWHGGDDRGEPGRIYFSRSIDGGETFSPRVDVSTAPADINHNFPALAAMGNGEVGIAWMDSRTSGPISQDFWNVWYRSSTDGGVSWSAEVQLSSFVAGYTYIFGQGFSFPYGDYYEMDFDPTGDVHVIWGAGESYNGAGHVWYSRGR